MTGRRENFRIGGLALAIFGLDQLTKWVVRSFLGPRHEQVVLEGFMKLVLWENPGAAFSMFHGNNGILAVVSAVALVVLVLIRHHFHDHTLLGQISLGLIFGGILGNLTDRILHQHVIDFLYFYVLRRDGAEAGFAAFNVADSAICIGVGLVFVLSWYHDTAGSQPGSAQAKG